MNVSLDLKIFFRSYIFSAYQVKKSHSFLSLQDKGKSRDKGNLQGCTMASNYTEYINSLPNQEQSTTYSGEKSEN